MAFKIQTKPLITPVPTDDVVFLNLELTFENVESFVRRRKRASCFDLMKAFGLQYKDTIAWMDALEDRGVIAPIPLKIDGAPLSAKARPLL